MIQARNLSARLGGRCVLEDVSFEAEPGQLTAIIGPNGSGKTTLLRAVSGEIPCSGDLTINGMDCRRLKPWQLAGMRAVLPQKTSLSFPFTVREVVALGLTGGRSGVGGHEAAALPDRALRSVDLDGFAGRFYQELSGGEQQRVQLARALCQVWVPVLDGMPRWLLLDEPVSSLDIHHQLAIMRLASEFAQAGGGVIAVLHDLNLTCMFADRILMMCSGRIDASGAPSEVMNDSVLAQVFGCALRVGVAPKEDQPFVLPHSVHTP